MSNKPEVEGPYIVWEHYGYEGWQPKSFPTLEEAVRAHRFQSEWVVTKVVLFEVVAREDSPPGSNAP